MTGMEEVKAAVGEDDFARKGGVGWADSQKWLSHIAFLGAKTQDGLIESEDAVQRSSIRVKSRENRGAT